MSQTNTILAELRTDVKWIKSNLEILHTSKANKWTETVLKFVGSGMGIAIIAALMGLLLAPKAYAFGQYISINLL